MPLEWARSHVNGEAENRDRFKLSPCGFFQSAVPATRRGRRTRGRCNLPFTARISPRMRSVHSIQKSALALRLRSGAIESGTAQLERPFPPIVRPCRTYPASACRSEWAGTQYHHALVDCAFFDKDHQGGRPLDDARRSSPVELERRTQGQGGLAHIECTERIRGKASR